MPPAEVLPDVRLPDVTPKVPVSSRVTVTAAPDRQHATVRAGSPIPPHVLRAPELGRSGTGAASVQSSVTAAPRVGRPEPSEPNRAVRVPVAMGELQIESSTQALISCRAASALTIVRGTSLGQIAGIGRACQSTRAEERGVLASDIPPFPMVSMPLVRAGCVPEPAPDVGRGQAYFDRFGRVMLYLRKSRYICTRL